MCSYKERFNNAEAEVCLSLANVIRAATRGDDCRLVAAAQAYRKALYKCEDLLHEEEVHGGLDVSDQT